MKLTTQTKLRSFKAWSGAEETLQVIIREDKIEELENLIEELFPDGLTETQLNDILWHDDEWIFEQLGM
jgi:hypothetical protein